jgi:hypothetical protein
VAISFVTPSYRAASSDLTIAISPLGLVELADEEFEVHGPRLNRYASQWAWYLGHHWSYKREIGEPQMTFNWSAAFSDFLTNFCLTNGVNFRSPHATEAIVPELLRTVWEEHQPQGKEAVLWEAMQQGGVSGDCFIKVAFEEEYPDPAGNVHPAKIRILPLNAAFCFPEYHPHDMTRMIRFKMKYRFWGCVDPETEALTRRGWKKHHQITCSDEILTLNPWTDAIEWQRVEKVSVYPYKGEMHRWTGKVDALTTPNHRWLAEVSHGRAETYRREREIVFSGLRPNSARLITGGGAPTEFADQPKWTDELVETIGWYVTEGVDHYNQTGFHTIRISQHKDSRFIGRLRRLAAFWQEQGLTCNEWKSTAKGIIDFYFGKGSNTVFEDVAPGKQLTPEFLCSLTFAQAKLLYETLLDGDGCRTRGQERWTQIDLERVSGFQMLSGMLGMRGRYFQEKVTNYATRYSSSANTHEEVVDYDDVVWCPTVENSIWFARRNGTTYWTGNTALEGTRQVFSFCVDDQTEALTDRGWKHYWEIEDGDRFLTINPVTEAIEWQSHSAVNLFDWDGPLTRWQNKAMDALTTPQHRWLIRDWRERDPRYQDRVGPWQFRTTEQLSTGKGRTEVVAGGGTPFEFSETATYTDELVELVAWVVTEGHYQSNPAKPGAQGIIFSQSVTANPEKVERIRALLKKFDDCTISEYDYEYANSLQFYLGKGIASTVRAVAPEKSIDPAFLCALTEHQARLFWDVLMLGDGHVRDDGPTKSGQERRNTRQFAQTDQGRIDGFQMLAAMLGIRTHSHRRKTDDGSDVTAYHRNSLRVSAANPREEHYQGIVWCPSLPNKTFFARRNGITYWTGNTELWTEDAMQAFINDELVESQENPLGVIPFVHISNRKVPSSPWGLSDIQDITDLNRQYNETATLITDIIDYYASPTTVIIGAKSNALERGPKKVWSIPNDKASITNLTLGAELEQALNFLELLKEKMHELVGVPVNALGQPQEISNTSGVALSLQFLPLVQKFKQKTTQYKAGFAQLNEIIIRTAALYMPEMLQIDPDRDPPVEDGQLMVLDPRDPLTYRNTVAFASPLPIDELIALNTIQMKMMLGLESKEGALRTLGEAYPAEKLQELYEELHQDSLEQGALDLQNAQIAMLVSMLSGMPLGGQEPGGATNTAGGPAGGVQSAGGPGVNSASGVQAPQVPPLMEESGMQDIMQRINTISQGTKAIQVRNPLKGSDD